MTKREKLRRCLIETIDALGLATKGLAKLQKEIDKKPAKKAKNKKKAKKKE